MIFFRKSCEIPNFWIDLKKSGEKWGKVVDCVKPFFTFVLKANSR
ncbi:hypothetical protein B879_00367 [Cecembia lonarensis LW9]|uniref:Uncharacterized protein n=1 Tax=Cecembia lonarensis (strain CCUG 58316 / KCTC 22772 / LW9) TaxID=1225176 RepID=K1L8T2_CECL9|nr:hypothetical protein B879_00367 [Cecembia lonarensis LW9]